MTRSSIAPVARSRQLSQSWGRQTAAVRATASGSCSASQRSLLIVNDATGTTPTSRAQVSAPSSSVSAAAASAERVSFHSNAGRTTAPAASRQTIPCCWPPTPTASTSSSPPASAAAVSKAAHQASGWTSVPSGWPARPSRTTVPVAASTTTTLHDCVEVSTPATSVIATAPDRQRVP